MVRRGPGRNSSNERWPMSGPTLSSWTRDLTAGMVVFLVAIPLCLGVPLACNAPPFAGVLAGIIGGILVGVLSGSHTSVSGPSPAVIAIVAAQIASLGSFQAFLLALLIAGAFQLALGVARAGFLAAFVPSSVIKGLLAAIGVILILKQIPHLLGHDSDPEGEMAFQQPDHENTFSEFLQLGDFHYGAALIGLASLALLVVWDRVKPLKKSPVPAPLVVVLLGVGLAELLRRWGGNWVIGPTHLVQVPVSASLTEFVSLLQLPDFSRWNDPRVYTGALTIAAVASLETLLNLEAVDNIDPRRRTSPPSRELFAQGVGNVVSGLAGGLPVTSVIVRSSVNINAGSQSKLSAIIHGVLLFTCVLFLPQGLNMIPLSCLAAILLVTGVKLVSPSLVQQMWSDGRYQFVPFIVTVLAIVFTDLLIGILVGLAVAISFILNSNVRRPLRRSVEKHLGGDVVHIELANQVSFLNRAALLQALDALPAGGHVLLDAHNTDYIDPDVLALIRDFASQTGPARGVKVSLSGFRQKYHLRDETRYVDHATRELQSLLTPQQVLQILRDGHERFRSGKRLTRNWSRQVMATASGQHPLAVVLSCIDSRTPAELIFDLGVGDIFSVRIAGNVTSRKILGSVEYGCAVAGAKLIVVMGHTRCGAVTAAVDLYGASADSNGAFGCEHIGYVVDDIQQAIDPQSRGAIKTLHGADKEALVNSVSQNNVGRTVELLRRQSTTLDALVRAGRIAIVGAMYDVKSGDITFLESPPESAPAA